MWHTAPTVSGEFRFPHLVRVAILVLALITEPKRGGFGAAVAAFPIALLVWYLVGRIGTFGFFWTEAGAAGSWGDPALIGAWAVHFFGALGMVVICMWLLRPLTRWQVHPPDLADSPHSR